MQPAHFSCGLLLVGYLCIKVSSTQFNACAQHSHRARAMFFVRLVCRFLRLTGMNNFLYVRNIRREEKTEFCVCVCGEKNTESVCVFETERERETEWEEERNENIKGETNKEEVRRTLSISLRTLQMHSNGLVDDECLCLCVLCMCVFTVECVFHFLHFMFSWFPFLSMFSLLLFYTTYGLFAWFLSIQSVITMPKKVIAIWKSLIILSLLFSW